MKIDSFFFNTGLSWLWILTIRPKKSNYLLYICILIDLGSDDQLLWGKIISSDAWETKYNFHNLQNQHAIFWLGLNGSLQIMRFSEHSMLMGLSPLFSPLCNIAEEDWESSSTSLFRGGAPDSDKLSVQTSFCHPTVPRPSVGFCLCHGSPHLKNWLRHGESQLLCFFSWVFFW